MITKDKIISKILASEGGYVFDDADSGKETYRGISRRFHPEWKGWKTVDLYKPLKTNQLIKSDSLEKDIISFYDTNYFKSVKGDEIKSDMIRTHLFDMAVNAGIKTSIKLLQNAICDVFDIKIDVDGLLGKISLSYINNVDKMEELEKAFIQKRISYYESIVKTHPKNLKFLKGWLNRIKNTTAFVETNK